MLYHGQIKIIDQVYCHGYIYPRNEVEGYMESPRLSVRPSVDAWIKWFSRIYYKDTRYFIPKLNPFGIWTRLGYIVAGIWLVQVYHKKVIDAKASKWAEKCCLKIVYLYQIPCFT